MLEQIKTLTSRRAYEFRPDDLRLTLLSTEENQELIKQLFHFPLANIGTPITTFGPIQNMLPPGLVFNLGRWVSPEGQVIPIRFLHFEPRRIVIDVAGPSGAIDFIFQQLCEGLADQHLVDGTPVIGEPQQILDYSEITARFSTTLQILFAQKVREVLLKALSSKGSGEELVVSPTVYLQMETRGKESTGAVVSPDSRVFQLAPRLETRPEEHIYFSGAPLDSETHLAYLEELEAALAS